MNTEQISGPRMDLAGDEIKPMPGAWMFCAAEVEMRWAQFGSEVIAPVKASKIMEQACRELGIGVLDTFELASLANQLAMLGWLEGLRLSSRI